MGMSLQMLDISDQVSLKQASLDESWQWVDDS